MDEPTKEPLRDARSTARERLHSWIRWVWPHPNGRCDKLDKDAVHLGRSADNDVVVEHISVSRQHAVLYPKHDGVGILVRSHHGVRINGQEAAGEGTSHAPYGSVLRFGDCVGVLVGSSSDDPDQFGVRELWHESGQQLIGSARLAECLQEAQRVAKLAAGHRRRRQDGMPLIALVGETGTGKELLARWIHGFASGSSMPFVSAAANRFPETLLSSELQGTKKGAYPDAQDRPGLFARAHRGTLFFDEAHRSPPLLEHILRILSSGSVGRVGGDKEEKIDVVVVATFQRPPHETEGVSDDLLGRIHGTVTLPAMRERKEDVPELLRQGLLRTLPEKCSFRRRLATSPEACVSPDLTEWLCLAPWRENVRGVFSGFPNHVAALPPQLLEIDSLTLEHIPAQLKSTPEAPQLKSTPESPSATTGFTREQEELIVWFALGGSLTGFAQHYSKLHQISLEAARGRLNRRYEGVMQQLRAEAERRKTARER